ncbi:MAG: hypothetical protein LC624_03155 [Halobacteriales archaeon]|nr:hypothetical protein [Halobacteriales archaeon]
MRAMKLLAVLPVALVLLSVAPPADAFFHWAPWSGTGVAYAADGTAYAMTLRYAGITGYPYPFPVTVTLTNGASTITKTFLGAETFQDLYDGSYQELLGVTLRSNDPSVQLTATGYQYATEYPRQFTSAVQGTFNGLTFAVAVIDQPF